MKNYYLIPANSKKSMNILGIFTPSDLILFASGVLSTLILLMIFRTTSFIEGVILLIPALVAGFLVFPLPNYHNVLQLIINIYTYYFVRQKKYKWKGWCYKNGQRNKR